MISWLALDDREMVIIKIGRGEHLHFNRKRPKTSTLGRLGINGLKKFSGKFESFVHKLIKKQPYRDFLIQIFWNISAPGKYPWFDTKATPTQAPKSFTSTLHFNHSWLRQVTSIIRHFDPSFRQFVATAKVCQFLGFFVGVTDCRNDVSKWRMVDVTCRSDRWLKSRVEVKDFGAWEGVALVSKWRFPTGGLWNSNSWLKIFKPSQT